MPIPSLLLLLQCEALRSPGAPPRLVRTPSRCQTKSLTPLRSRWTESSFKEQIRLLLCHQNHKIIQAFTTYNCHEEVLSARKILKIVIQVSLEDLDCKKGEDPEKVILKTCVKEANRQEFVLIKEEFEAGEDILYWISVNIRDRIERGLPPPWDPDWDPISPYDIVVDAIAVNWRGGTRV